MRSVSATLATAQSAASRTPYIKMLFTSGDGLTTKDFSTNSVAFGNRILSIKHHEEAYNDYAVVILKDPDSIIPNIRGYWTEIGYGDTTGAGNEYSGSQTARLYVKHQRHVTAQGKLYTALELEGLWTRMHQTIIRIGSAPLFQSTYDGTTNTVYSILKLIFTHAGLSLPVASPVDDGIINTLKPIFALNENPYERVKSVVFRLIGLTRCYLRPPSATGLEFGVVWPQAGDAVALTYYSGQSPYFHTFMERAAALVPNHWVVYGNQGTDGDWTGLITSAAPDGVSQADIDALYEVYAIALAPDMTLQAEVNTQAAVRLIRTRAENESGIALIPHDCRLELYDKLAFVDSRGGGTTYPTNNMTRVGGLVHTYEPGKYQLEIHLGGASTTEKFAADTIIQGKELDGLPVSEELIALEKSLQAIENPLERALEDPRIYQLEKSPQAINYPLEKTRKGPEFYE